MKQEFHSKFKETGVQDDDDDDNDDDDDDDKLFMWYG